MLRTLTALIAGSAKPIVIIFTDGYSTIPHDEAAAALRQKMPDVYAIGVKDQSEQGVNMKGLESLTGDPKRVYTDANINDFYTELAKFTADCGAV